MYEPLEACRFLNNVPDSWKLKLSVQSAAGIFRSAELFLC